MHYVFVYMYVYSVYMNFCIKVHNPVKLGNIFVFLVCLRRALLAFHRKFDRDISNHTEENIKIVSTDDSFCQFRGVPLDLPIGSMQR